MVCLWFVASGILVVLWVLLLEVVVCLVAYTCAYLTFGGVATCLCYVVVLKVVEALGELALPSKQLVVIELVVLE